MTDIPQKHPKWKDYFNWNGFFSGIMMGALAASPNPTECGGWLEPLESDEAMRKELSESTYFKGARDLLDL